MFDLESEGLEGGAKRKFLSSSSLSSASFWPSPIPLIVLVQFFSLPSLPLLFEIKGSSFGSHKRKSCKRSLENTQTFVRDLSMGAA